MSKLPTKQIYLLLIIIVGIIALSVYSTYAIFTFESETSDVVSLHTPNSLSVSASMYEYKQLTIPANETITSDVDIYNTYDYELCYSIWYKVASKTADANKVNIYENTDASITTSSVISSMNSKRINLIITNDNDSDVKINIGLSSAKNEGTCELNISKDKSNITSTLNNPQKLTDMIIENNKKTLSHEEGYLTYKNLKTAINLDYSEIYIAKTFTLANELFTLTDPKLIDIKDIEKYQSSENQVYYTCLMKTECQNLYKINKIAKETRKNEITNEDEVHYQLTNYDSLIGYQKGTSGIKKITKDNIDNYIYYGDNPNNFIYYNCTNNLDTNTCELWRIIGIIQDEKGNYLTKIIKNDPIIQIQYSTKTDNQWKNSTLNEYLNKKYQLNDDSYLEDVKYQSENLLNLDTTIDKITNIIYNEKTKFAVMSLTDYLNASTCENQSISTYDKTCLTNNWLNNNTREWTMTIKYLEPSINEAPDETITPLNNTVYTVGSTIEETLITDTHNIRPVAYLKSRILLASGDGSLESPYIIK